MYNVICNLRLKIELRCELVLSRRGYRRIAKPRKIFISLLCGMIVRSQVSYTTQQLILEQSNHTQKERKSQRKDLRSSAECLHPRPKRIHYDLFTIPILGLGLQVT